MTDKLMYGGDNVPRVAPCFTCKWHTSQNTCEAFDETIPLEILLGKNDHSENVPGDNGKKYKKRVSS